MNAQCSIHFSFVPCTATWTTRATLRVDAKLLGYCDDLPDAPPRNLATASPLLSGGSSDGASTQLQLLLYVSAFHQLTEVALEEVEEEDCPLDRSTLKDSVLRKRATGSASTSRTTTSSAGGAGNSRRVRTVLPNFEWLPYAHHIHHINPHNTYALASSLPAHSDAGGEAEVKSKARSIDCEETRTPQTLFSTLLSSIPSSVGFAEEEAEDDANRDQLVLQFDSFTSSSEVHDTTTSHLKSEMVHTTEETCKPQLNIPQGSSGPTENADVPFPRVPIEAAVQILPPPVPLAPSPPNDEAVHTSAMTLAAASPPRRLLLLRPGNANAEKVESPTTTVPLSSEPSSFLPTINPPRGRRVLNINATAKPPPVQPPVPLAEVKSSAPLPVKSPSTADVKVEVPRHATADVKEAAALRRERPGCRAWTPYIFSFSYRQPSLFAARSTTVVTGTAPASDDDSACGQRPSLKRRLVAVHLTFQDATAVLQGTPMSSVCGCAQRSAYGSAGEWAKLRQPARWSRASVASSGWFAKTCGSASHDEHSCHDYSSQGYAFIMGDASLQTCWLCPLVAAIKERDFDATSDPPSADSAGAAAKPLLKAGPLTDVWVSAVSATVLSSSESSKKALVEGEQMDSEKDRISDPLHALSEPVSTVLPCVHFAPSWLSQLSCAFGPPQLQANVNFNNKRDHAATSSYSDAAAAAAAVPLSNTKKRRSSLPPRPLAHTRWPSSSIGGLLWSSMRTVADCAVLHAGFLSEVNHARSDPVANTACCVCLQSNVHLCDALYAYVHQLRLRWQQEGTSLDVSPFSAAPAEERAGIEREEGTSIMLTRVAPTCLSLCGGAVGSTSGIVVAEETAFMAELATVSVGNSAWGEIANCQTVAALRARVAITAATVQHFLRRALCAEDVVETTPQASQNSFGLHEGDSADLREVTGRFACVARAVALQWVCSSAAAVPCNLRTVHQFLAEERFVMKSAASVGRLLQRSEHNGNKRSRDPNAIALNVLQVFQRRYTAASLAGLMWMADHAAAMQWVRNRGVVVAGLLAERRNLCRWALQPHTLANDTSAQLRGLRGKSSFTQFLRRFLFLCANSSQGGVDCSAELAEEVEGSVLKGCVDVSIQHTPVLNTLNIRLDWRTTETSAPSTTASHLASGFATGGDADAPVRELPFFLFVFVVQGPVSKKQMGGILDSNDKRETVGDAQPARNSTITQLYQVTPFSWHLPARSCTTVGATAHVSLSVMHALDFVARRPDTFAQFDPTGVAGSPRAALRQSPVSPGGARKRRRMVEGVDDDGAASLPAVSTVARGPSRTKLGRAAQPRGRGRPPLRRRRTQRDSDVESSGDTTDNSDGYEGEGSTEDSAGESTYSAAVQQNDGNDDNNDVAEEEEEDGTLFLSLSSRGRRKGGKRTATTAHRRSGAGLSRSRVRSALDNARVIPMTVYRSDCAVPLLDVEVRHADLLAAQLSAAGFTSDKDEGTEESITNPSATHALCRLLSHLIGFSTAHAALPEQIDDLRRRQENALHLCPSSSSIAPTRPPYRDTNALTHSSVLHAYASLLRGVLTSLTRTTEPPSALRSMVNVGKVLSHVLDAASVTAAVHSALAEYARQDAACRRRVVEHELESDFDELVVLSQITSDRFTAAERKRTRTKNRMQRRMRRGELLLHNEQAVEAAWTSHPSATSESFLSVFYNTVLPSSFCRRLKEMNASLSVSAKTTADLAKWTATGRSFSSSSSCSPHASLAAKLNVLQACGESAQTLPLSCSTGAPPTMVVAPSARASLPTALRLQLKSTPSPKPAEESAHVPYHTDSVPQGRTSSGLALPSGLFPPPAPASQAPTKLREMMAGQLGWCPYPSTSEKKEEDERVRLLGIAAEALTTSAGVVHTSSEQSAAASFALSIAQLPRSGRMDGGE